MEERAEQKELRMRYLIVLGLFGLSACAALNRNPRSGYAYDEYDQPTSAQDLYQQREARVEEEAREELGYSSRELTEDERAAIETRIRLKRMESHLVNKREKKQYYEVRSLLRSDRERLNFLSLPTFEARERWSH